MCSCSSSLRFVVLLILTDRAWSSVLKEFGGDHVYALSSKLDDYTPRVLFHTNIQTHNGLTQCLG